ncbi:MAG: hypothetical protein RL481_5 [Pseudomonadota bacterium]|jgi:hypothetical protein
MGKGRTAILASVTKHHLDYIKRYFAPVYHSETQLSYGRWVKGIARQPW